MIMILFLTTALSFIPQHPKTLVFPMLILIYAFGIEMFIVNRIARIVAIVVLLTLLFTFLYI